MYNKIYSWIMLVFITHPMILCSSLVEHHGMIYSTTLRRIQEMHERYLMQRLTLIKLKKIIEQKARTNVLNECNTTSEEIISEIKKKYDEIDKKLAKRTARRPPKLRVKDFIQVYHKQDDLSVTSTNHRKVHMMFKNGRCLTQNKTGKIFGTIIGVDSDRNTVFSVKSHGPNILMIQNLQTKQFIAMDKHGHLYSRDNSSFETLFYLRVEENHFYTLASYRYYLVCPFDMFVAIRKNGVIKSPHQSVPGQDSTQFVLIPAAN